MTKFDKLMGLLGAWDRSGRGTYSHQWAELNAYARECLPDRNYFVYFGLSNRNRLHLGIRRRDYLGRPRDVEAIVTRDQVRVEPDYITGKVNRRFVTILETLHDQV